MHPHGMIVSQAPMLDPGWLRIGKRTGCADAGGTLTRKAQAGLNGHESLGVRKHERPRNEFRGLSIVVSVRCRTGEYYADAFTPAIQVRATEATEQ